MKVIIPTNPRKTHCPPAKEKTVNLAERKIEIYRRQKITGREIFFGTVMIIGIICAILSIAGNLFILVQG